MDNVDIGLVMKGIAISTFALRSIALKTVYEANRNTPASSWQKMWKDSERHRSTPRK